MTCLKKIFMNINGTDEQQVNLRKQLDSPYSFFREQIERYVPHGIIACDRMEVGLDDFVMSVNGYSLLKMFGLNCRWHDQAYADARERVKRTLLKDGLLP